MLPESYRRLWRRRLRRRPLLPFLLLTFVAVDFAVPAFDFDKPNEGVYAPFLLGIVLGQVSLLGVWAVSRPRGVLVRLLMAVPLAAVVTMLLSIAMPDTVLVIATFIIGYLLMSAAVAAVVIALRNLFIRGLRPRLRARYKIGILLVAMTVIPFVIYAVQIGEWKIFAQPSVFFSVACELGALASTLVLALWIRSAGKLLAVYVMTAFSLFLAFSAFGDSDDPILSFGYYLGYLVSVGSALVVLRVRRRTLTTPKSEEEKAPEETESAEDPIDLIA